MARADEGGETWPRRSGVALGLGRGVWVVVASALMVVAVMGWILSLESVGEGLRTRSFLGSSNVDGGDEDRLIPFLPELTKTAQLALRDDLYTLDVDRVKTVSWVPYRFVRDVCRSQRFNLSQPSPDRVLYEISVGNCGSTWQLVMLGKIIRMNNWRLPIALIPKGVIDDWPGLENVSIGKEASPGSWGEGEMYGKMFKVQHFQPELFDNAAIIFNAFKLSQYHSDMNLFAKGICPCCYLMKELLGDRNSEVAMIYMHALALGIDVTEEDVYAIRLNLAAWIQRKYCWPGSIHTSACSVVDEFPELHGNLPFIDYSDLEDVDDDANP